MVDTHYLFSTLIITALITIQCIAQDDEMYAHFINVGQANATLLQFPCGIILIDAGSQDEASGNNLLTYLDSFFEANEQYHSTIDAMIITHNHIDHTRMVREISERYTVKRYIDNGLLYGQGKTDPIWIRNNAANIEKEEITFAQVTGEGTNKNGYTDDMIDPLSCADIKVLSGRFDENPGWSSEAFDNMNNHSIVIRVDFDEASFLFTGDLEEDGITTLLNYYINNHNIFDTDVYEVGHHGSYNGTTTSLLKAITPDIAVISCGVWNFGKNSNYPFTTYRYGHPRKSTIDILKTAITKQRPSPISVMVATASKKFSKVTISDKIYSTAWDGNIKIKAKKDGTFEVFGNQ